MTRNEQGAGGELAQNIFLRQVVHQHPHFFGMFGVLDWHKGCAAGHTRASGRATGVGDDLPVEGIANGAGELADLPATRHVEDDLAVDKQFVGRGIAGRTSPHIQRHRAVGVPIYQHLRHGAETFIGNGGVAIGIKIFGSLADGGASKAVAGAIHRHRKISAGGFSHLAAEVGPLFPGGVAGWHVYASLVKQGFVDVGASDGQLGHHTIDAAGVSGRPHPIEEGAKIAFPVGRVHIGADVEEIFRQATEVGDAG